jgi:xanthine/uracil/vitamin C permease (AzgA family)
MVLSYSITKGIGIGLLSFTLMSLVAYLIELVKSAITKTERPKWNISVITIIVSILFAVYFFVPTVL